MSTLAPLRAELLGERLLAGESPSCNGPEDTLSKAVNAAMGVLATDLAKAADAAIAQVERTATERVGAADARSARATTAEAQMALERERALGEVSALNRALAEDRGKREKLEGELAAALKREVAVRDTLAATDAELSTGREAIERTRGTVLALGTRVGELQEALDRERHARACEESETTAERARNAATVEALMRDRERLDQALAGERERTVALAADLAAARAERESASARAEEAVSRILSLESERDTTRRRAERLDAELEASRVETRTALNERRTAQRAILELHPCVQRLQLRLREAGIPAERVEQLPEHLSLERLVTPAPRQEEIDNEKQRTQTLPASSVKE